MKYFENSNRIYEGFQIRNTGQSGYNSVSGGVSSGYSESRNAVGGAARNGYSGAGNFFSGMQAEGNRNNIYKSDIAKLTKGYGYKIGFFTLAFFLFTINLIALAISMNCSKAEPLGFRIASGLYAFMFGFIYIFINYLNYRIKTRQDTCRICTEKPFIFF